MSDTNINNLNINSLDQFNDVLANALTNPSSIKTSWLGSRESFTLSHDTQSVEVKMNDIIIKFQELAESANKNDRLRLLGDIRYKIVALDLKGDEELSKQGIGALAFRNLKNIGSISHVQKVDDILNRHLFNDVNVTNRANSLLRKLGELDNLVKSKNEAIREINGLDIENQTLNKKTDKSDEETKKVEENELKIGELENKINKCKEEISQKKVKIASEIVSHALNESKGNNYVTINALRCLVQKNPQQLKNILRIIDNLFNNIIQNDKREFFLVIEGIPTRIENEIDDVINYYNETFKKNMYSLKVELRARTSREASLKYAPYAPLVNEIKKIYADAAKYPNFYDSLLDSGVVKFENNYKDLLEILAKSDLFTSKKILEALIEETEGVDPVTSSSRLKKDVHDFCEDLLRKVNKHLERA